MKWSLSVSEFAWLENDPFFAGCLRVCAVSLAISTTATAAVAIPAGWTGCPLAACFRCRQQLFFQS